MNATIIIAVCYIAFVSLVLRILRFVRDRNIVETEYYNEENLDATGHIPIHTNHQHSNQSNKRYA